MKWIYYVEKVFYPYEWFDDVEKFIHLCLPSIDDFHSTLKQKTLSKDEYEHAENVYNK